MSKNEAARARIREVGGAELLDRLTHLDATRGSRAPLEHPPAPEGASTDVDVIIAGGGLSLLYAPLLAKKGLSVAVIERGTAGVTHREWNASRTELQALVACGLFTADELESLMITEYDYGVCTWAGGGSYPVKGVLDVPTDAPRLLRETRAKAELLGVQFFDHHTVLGETASKDAIAVRARGPNGPVELVAKLLVDARGASSPYADADLICPTVGGVLAGLDVGSGPTEIDPRIGEILVTTEGVFNGRQHIWEGFPGRPDETTVYLFYYAHTDAVGPGALTELYAQFFETLPVYKTGDWSMVRPTFGYIPGWSRLGTPPVPSQPRIALVGDAAARHSPLTFCGFGATLRSIGPGAEAIAALVEQDDRSGEPIRCVVDERKIHQLTGGLSRLMADPPTTPPNALNDLLNLAFSSLYELGDAQYAALLRDEMEAEQFFTFLSNTAAKDRGVYAQLLRSLGIWRTSRWGFQVAGQLLRASLA